MSESAYPECFETFWIKTAGYNKSLLQAIAQFERTIVLSELQRWPFIQNIGFLEGENQMAWLFSTKLTHLPAGNAHATMTHYYEE